MDKALITYGWNRVAYIVNRSLSSKGIRTYVGDLSYVNMNRFSKFSYASFRYPNFYKSPENFLTFITEYMNRNGIEYLFPVHEETFIFSKNQHKLKEKNIKILLPDFYTIKKAHKKNTSVEIAKKVGIPVPETFTPKSFEDMKSFFNCHNRIVIKYINTNSAKGVFYPKSIEELKLFEKDIGSFIMQERVNGVGYGVSMLYNRGELRAKFTHKRLQEKNSTGGTSVLRVSVKNELLEEYAKELLDILNWNGVAMVEFKYNENKKKGWFIEINPRFWGSLALPYFAGIDFPYLVYKILKEGDIEPHFNYKTGIKVKWILGGIIAFITEAVKRKKINFSLLSLKADGYDDLWTDDKKILLGEFIYYFTKFVSSLSLNPTKDSLMNIDEL